MTITSKHRNEKEESFLFFVFFSVFSLWRFPSCGAPCGKQRGEESLGWREGAEAGRVSCSPQVRPEAAPHYQQSEDIDVCHRSCMSIAELTVSRIPTWLKTRLWAHVQGGGPLHRGQHQARTTRAHVVHAVCCHLHISCWCVLHLACSNERKCLSCSLNKELPSCLFLLHFNWRHSTNASVVLSNKRRKTMPWWIFWAWCCNSDETNMVKNSRRFFHTQAHLSKSALIFMHLQLSGQTNYLQKTAEAWKRWKSVSLLLHLRRLTFSWLQPNAVKTWRQNTN